MTSTQSQATYSLELEHTFCAPREKVFEAWTQPEQLMQWFGSPQSKNNDAKVDLRVGGAYHIAMDSAQFGPLTISGSFREVDPPRKLVYTWCVDPSPGALIRNTLVSVEFHERGAWTDLTLRHEVLPDELSRQQHNDGWNGCFDSLADFLK